MAKVTKSNHVKTVIPPSLPRRPDEGGCLACHVSCQSACKTSCTVGNQPCESGSTVDSSGGDLGAPGPRKTRRMVHR